MAQHINDLIAILTQGQQVIDPRAAFLGQQFQAGTLPGDPTSNLNTILDLLSPSAAADFQDRSGGPAVAQERLGISPEQLDQFINQSLGLQIAPREQLAADTTRFAALPDLMRGQAAQETAAARTSEAQTKEKEAGIKSETEARLKKKGAELTPAEADQLFDLQLKQMVLTGVDPKGNPIDAATKGTMFKLLRLTQSSPEALAFINGLAKAGDLESIARLLGVPEDKMERGFFQGFEGLLPGATIPGSTGQAAPTGESDIQQFLDADRQSIIDLLSNIDPEQFK